MCLQITRLYSSICLQITQSWSSLHLSVINPATHRSGLIFPCESKCCHLIVTCLCSCNHYRGFLSQPTTSLFSLVTAPCSCKSHSHSLRTACKSHCLHAALRPCKPHSHCPWLTCKSYWCKLKQALIISLAQSLNARPELLPNTWAIVEAPMPSFVTCPLYLIPSLHRCTRVSVICQNTRGFQVTHNFSCNHYWGFQCDPQLPFIEGFSATHNFPLSRVSVRPTTSFYLIIFYSSLLLQITQS